MVHAEGDWHRAVHIWMYNSHGKLVLQKRAAGKDTFPGCWDVSVGGHVTSGDSVLETALKEVQEELGIYVDAADLEALGTLATTARGSSPVGGDFICNEFKDVFLLKFDGDLAGCVRRRA
jgi:isopentenyl-diphosphate delta-isomerase